MPQSDVQSKTKPGEETGGSAGLQEEEESAGCPGKEDEEEVDLDGSAGLWIQSCGSGPPSGFVYQKWKLLNPLWAEGGPLQFSGLCHRELVHVSGKKDLLVFFYLYKEDLVLVNLVWLEKVDLVFLDLWEKEHCFPVFQNNIFVALRDEDLV